MTVRDLFPRWTWDHLDQEIGPGLRKAVNVSTRLFRSKGFAAQVRRIVDESGVPPRRLELELTESILVREQKEAVAILGQLKALGLGVVLDDFGTGYSSLHYLSRGADFGIALRGGADSQATCQRA